MRFVIRLLVFFVCVFLASCNLPIPGGAGSIKGYCYQTTKDKLEKAIMTVIKNNPNIYRDTTKYKSTIKNEDNGKVDTIIDNYYNDGKNYITIKIKAGDIENEYTFRFYGDEEYWKTSASSEIFIAYAYDDKTGKGGSEGYGGIDRELKKKLTSVFESEFVDKIDEQLHLNHTDDNE